MQEEDTQMEQSSTAQEESKATAFNDALQEIFVQSLS
jgi:hypothetical protein